MVRGNLNVSCTSTGMSSEVLALLRSALTQNWADLSPLLLLLLSGRQPAPAAIGQQKANSATEARLADGEVLYVIDNSQQLSLCGESHGHIEVDKGEEEGEGEDRDEEAGFKVKQGGESLGKFSELPILASNPIVVRK